MSYPVKDARHGYWRRLNTQAGLRVEAGKRVERERIAQAALVIAAAAFRLAAAVGRIWPDEVAADFQLGSGSFKWSNQFSSVMVEMVDEFKTIIGLHTVLRETLFFKKAHDFSKWGFGLNASKAAL